jgi:hypothetical protein
MISLTIIHRLTRLSFNDDLQDDSMPNSDTRYERNRRYELRLQAEGMRRIASWAPADAVEALRQAYPGRRGGIDWNAVIMAALDKAGVRASGDQS